MASNPARHPNKCVLCCPVSFFDSKLYYYEHFHVRFSKLEVRIAKNLYNDNIFHLFGKTPNWLRTIYGHPIIYFTDYDHFSNEFAGTTMKIFCNTFLSDNFFYVDFPLHQFLAFRHCIFTYSKKFLLNISAYINRKFFRFFFLFRLPIH